MKFRIVAAFALLVAGVAGYLPDPTQAQTCPLPPVALTLNQSVAAPAGYDQVAFFDVKSNTAVGSPGALGGTPPSFPVNSLVLAQAQAFKDPATHADNQIQLRWGKAADKTAGCLQPFTVSSSPPPSTVSNPAAATTPATGTTSSTGSTVNVQDCQSQGQQLRKTIRTQRRLGSSTPDDFSLIVFCRDVTALQIDRDYGVEGDPIYVALYDDGTLLSPHAQLPACSIEAAGPRIFQSETSLPSASGLQSTQVFRIQELLNRACFDTSVEIDLKAQRTDMATQKLADVSQTYVLGQAVRYNATLQVGPLFTNQQSHTFGLSVDSSNVSHILDQGPTGRGPEYLGTLVLYALPRQLASLFGGKPYHGRDIVHEQKFADRLGGVLGTGLSNPSKLFVAGFSFEIFSYVNVTAVYSWARLPELSGVQAGDVFTGTAAQIPVQDQWKGHVEFGLSVDLRYAAALLNR
ncbi:MAG TPA: hypothetical protein VFE33_10595 [Thermoanaerobaculia bacterium]|nr:hypothetical protein [Thermoanaerobaculia bacterium]